MHLQNIFLLLSVIDVRGSSQITEHKTSSYYEEFTIQNIQNETSQLTFQFFCSHLEGPNEIHAMARRMRSKDG